MDLAIFRRLTVDRQAKLFHHLAQLGVDVLPLAHAQIVKKIDPALAAELIRRQRLLLLAEVVPQIDEGEEIGLFIVEAAMFFVRGLLFVHRPLARVWIDSAEVMIIASRTQPCFCASSTIRARRGSTGSWLSWRPIGVSL